MHQLIAIPTMLLMSPSLDYSNHVKYVKVNLESLRKVTNKCRTMKLQVKKSHVNMASTIHELTRSLRVGTLKHVC